MRHIRRTDHVRMLWRNGKGLTEEILVMPAGAGLDGFDWRMSIAHVAADGPFSLFPGVDRTIALIEGAGLALDLPDGRNARLEAGGRPFAFPGEWAITSRNLGGPTIDLNVMTRRGRFRHAMRRLRLEPNAAFEAPAPGVAVATAETAVEHAAVPLFLARFDALVLEAGERLRLHGAVPADLIWTTIVPENADPALPA